MHSSVSSRSVVDVIISRDLYWSCQVINFFNHVNSMIHFFNHALISVLTRVSLLHFSVCLCSVCR